MTKRPSDDDVDCIEEPPAKVACPDTSDNDGKFLLLV
ncbi:unnamed protein product [Cylicostephanus goldi]|uniref:Uncharacterized protein n=1 Tax=Cylicostephanus goldi TaxID=71465 RepID=A0A3P7ND10_CYLGO|nr:unnamed protein product [Cylicostephanus goldi]